MVHNKKEVPLIEAEARATASGARYQSLVDSNFIGFFEGNRDGTITAANDRYLGVIGYSRADLEAGEIRWKELTPPSFAAATASALEGLHREGSYGPYEKELIRKDGGRVPVVTGYKLIPGQSAAVGFVVDVSDRRAAEQALRESEHRYRTLVEELPDGVFRVTEDGRFLEANAAMVQMLGYETREDLLAVDIARDLYRHPEDRDRALGPVAEGRVVQLQLRRQDGSLLYVEERAIATLDGEGRITGYQGMLRDITERRRAEEEVRRRETRYRTLFESSRDAVVILSDDGLVDCNQAAVALFGVPSREALQGAEPLDMSPEFQPDGRTSESVIAEHMREVYSTGGSVVEYVFRRPDGTEFPAEIMMSRFDLDGRAMVQALIRDQSERREAEDARRVSESRLRSLVEHAPMAIIRISGEGRFMSINPAGVEILGYESEQELLGLNLLGDVVTDAAAFEDAIARTGATHRPHDFDLDAVRRDGSALTLRGKMQEVPDEGSGDVVQIIAEDATERARLEEQLRQAQKMEAIGELTGGLAHDFNNLLSIIQLNTELMLSEEEAEESRAHLTEIADAGRKAAAMTRQLLGFSRKARLAMKATDPGDVVEGIGSMVRRLVPENIDLEIDIDSDLGVVSADAGAVEQMVLNLVTNGRDAMPEGGRLFLKVANREVDSVYCAAHPFAKEGAYVSISLSDNGSGMPPEVQKRVFEPFFSTKDAKGGTGLGLAMVYGLMKQHKGFVNVYSDVGVGTTITLYFPRQPAEVALVPDSVGRGPVRDGGGQTILFVEDEEALRSIGRRVLESAGYRVLEAGDGEEALTVIEDEAEPPDLVVSDLIMPRMGGAELLTTVSERWPEVRVLLISGHVDSGELSSRGVAGSIPLLGKPWNLEELLGSVGRALR